MSLKTFSPTVIALLTIGFGGLSGAPVTLQNATATFSQTDGANLFVADAIDGVTTGTTGWAIRSDPGGSNPVDAETAVFELATTLSSAHGYAYIFELYHSYGFSLISGRFRISVTSDDKSTFADGLNTGGDVTANWTVVDFDTMTATNGVSLTAQTDDSILTTTSSSSTSVFTLSGTIRSSAGNTVITGIRIELMEDSSLPGSGPGHYTDGNLVITEFTADFTEQEIEGLIDGDLEVTGSAGIGRSALSGYRLAVDGSIRAREIKVDADTWADFVFNRDYELPSLDSVESHISANGHLPGIPSEAEVRANGIGLAQMQVTLLQKIEEMTLYLIAQEKRIAALEAENAELKRQ